MYSDALGFAAPSPWFINQKAFHFRQSHVEILTAVQAQPMRHLGTGRYTHIPNGGPTHVATFYPVARAADLQISEKCFFTIIFRRPH